MKLLSLTEKNFSCFKIVFNSDFWINSGLKVNLKMIWLMSGSILLKHLGK